MNKYLNLFFAFLFLVIGVIGIILPLVPTTPFLLLSAYFFSSAHSKFYQKLLENKYVGKSIKDWNEYKVISLKAKMIATLTLSIVIIFKIIPLKLSIFFKGIIILILIGVLVFIWSKKSSYQDKE